MHRLWTPWRHDYVSGKDRSERKGVPADLSAWPGEDTGCVFCNMLRAVDWAVTSGAPVEAERSALLVDRGEFCFVCLNRYPYSTGHLMIVPYLHLGSLALLPRPAAEEIIRTAQKLERVLRSVYQPEGINLGMNLGEAAGAGVAEHLHLHILPRWIGDTNFMTVTAETRVLPETLDATWAKVRGAIRADQNQ